MRYLKVLVIFIISIILGSLLSNNAVKAHNDNLGIDGADDITYDSCIPDLFENNGGYSEVWYELTEYKDYNEVMDHIDDDIDIIYYKIHLDNTDVDWGSEVLSNMDNIKEGIDKWNQISVYKKDENGRLRAYPLVRFVDVDELEDTSNIDVNVDIRFENGNDWQPFLGITAPIESSLVGEDSTFTNGVYHKHYTKYSITLYPNQINSYERTMAHELGHVLGLKDVDVVEFNETIGLHHQELLMGYDSNNNYMESSSNITYRDIAGAMIARGLHTNADHKWLYDEESSTSTNHKLICSICNCVKYVDNLSEYTYDIYKQCEDGNSSTNCHSIESGNMMAVARYGNKDYWKCKYCRQTTGFTNNVEQNYSYQEIVNNKQNHILKNNVLGLEYELIEEHDFTVDLGNGIYKCNQCPVCSDGGVRFPGAEELTLECIMDSVNKTMTLSGAESKYYTLNINCISSYLIKATSNSPIKMELFDENLNKITIDPQAENSNKTLFYNRNFSSGTYYLKISLEEKNSSASVNLQVESNVDYYRQTMIINHTYDVFEHMHNSRTEFIFSNKINRLARIVLQATNENGDILYPEGSIVVKDELGNIINKYAVSSFDNLAISNEGQNNLLLYLEKDVDYIIEINYSQEYATTALVSLAFLETASFNSFNDDVVDLSDNIDASFDDLKTFNVAQNGKYKIDAKFTGFGADQLLFAIFTTENDSNNILQYIALSSLLMDSINDTFTVTMNMFDNKQYYIGFLGADLDGTMEVTFQQVIEDKNATFVTDPDVYTNCGTEVTINGGARRGNIITQGFNRLAYFDKAPSLSRLDYYWYSSDTNLLTVSIYGTIQALNVTENQEVTIMAVYKNDLTKVFKKKFQVVRDRNVGQQLIIYNVTLQKNDLWSIVTDEKWPSTGLQNYTWTTTNHNIASVSMWGTINALDVGTATIYGDYQFNRRYVIVVNVTIV